MNGGMNEVSKWEEWGRVEPPFWSALRSFLDLYFGAFGGFLEA